MEYTRMGGKQDNTHNKMRKVKSEIEGNDIIILTETHLDKSDNEIKKWRDTSTNTT